MREFAYHRPTSSTAAVDLRRRSTESAYLAGGMTLLPTIKQGLAAPSDLIDLAGLPNMGAVGRKDESLEIGAMVRHASVATSAEVKRAIPALAFLASQIGDAQV